MFSEIERQGHQVTKVGNPISFDMKTRYVVKGVNQEKIIQSVINIFTDDKGMITKVEDKWDGNLPDGSIKNVSRNPLSPFRWLVLYGQIGFYLFSFVWYTWPWMVRLDRSLSNLVEMRSITDCSLSIGLPPPQRQFGAPHGQGAKERRGGPPDGLPVSWTHQRIWRAICERYARNCIISHECIRVMNRLHCTSTLLLRPAVYEHPRRSLKYNPTRDQCDHRGSIKDFACASLQDENLSALSLRLGGQSGPFRVLC